MFGGLLQLLSQTTEDTLHLVLEAIAALIKVDSYVQNTVCSAVTV